MKRQLLFFILFLIPLFISAQLNQGFEEETFPPEGWKISSLNTNNRWTREARPSLALPDGGDFTVRCRSGYSKEDADSWMITPSISISDGDHLDFSLYVYSAASLHSVCDTLDILVSETTQEREAFSKRLFRIMPQTVTSWNTYCIDLSEFKEKTIYIAFRDYLISPPDFVSGSTFYMDNIKISSSGSTDLSLAELISPQNDCATEQAVEVTVKNTGKAVDNFTVAYKINDGEVVRESFAIPIAFGESQTVTFEQKAYLETGTTSEFSVWVESASDNNPVNDTITSNIAIGKQLIFPYKMSESPTAESDFINLGLLGGSWQYMSGMWIFVGSPGAAVLGSNCIDLPTGKIKISYKYMSPQASIQLQASVHNNQNVLGYTKFVGLSDTHPFNTGYDQGSFVAHIPEGGLQSLGLRVLSPPGEPGGMMQVIITDIQIEVLYEDLSIDAILTPWGDALIAAEEGMEVKVKITNAGMGDQTEFDLYYQLDDNEPVKETYSSVLNEGFAIDYIFDTKIELNSVGAHTLKVWLDSPKDEDEANNAIEKNIFVYIAKGMPYYMSFEDDEDFESWIIYNANQDAIFWQKGDVHFKGEKVMVLPSVGSSSNDDWLITPGINMTQGKARISFYYAATSEGEMNLEVLMGKECYPDKMGTVLIAKALQTTDWVTEFSPLDIEEAGIYYFAFKVHGTNGEIILDEVRIDTQFDAAITSVSFTEKNGYNLNESEVKLAFINQSFDDISNVKVSYVFDGSEPVSEIIAGPIAPGVIHEHSFTSKVDISETGMHRVIGSVEIENDIEPANNSKEATMEHYKNKHVPYFQDFEDYGTRLRWLETAIDVNKDGNAWIVAGNAIFDAYSGMSCLYYDSSTAPACDDWIFSECIEIPSGEMDFSFFYRTYKNLEERKENFKIMLGKSPQPDAMTITLADLEQVAVVGVEHAKFVGNFNIEAGKYYLGVYTEGPQTRGMIVIDDISIKPYEEKIPFYESDFSLRFDEWTRYNLISMTFDQWISAEEEGHSTNVAELKTSRSNPSGFFVSPGFKLEKDQEIDLNFEYSILSPSNDDKIQLYMGSANHPDSLNILLVEIGGNTDWATFGKKIKAKETGRYYFGFRAVHPNTDIKDVLYKIAGFKLTPSGLNTYEVKGILTQKDETPIKNAIVKLEGGQSYSVITGNDGTFTMPAVVDRQEYTLSVSENYYLPYRRNITLNSENLNLGAIELEYKIEIPVNVTASINNENKVIDISWLEAGSEIEFRYDDGKEFGQIGFNNGGASDIVGTVFRKAARITDISWFITNAGSPRDKVNIYILDIDSEGAPTTNILYSEMDIPNVTMQWSSYQLPEAVNAPNGFMLAISYSNGSVCLGIDDGIDDYPFMEDTYYIGNIERGEFDKFENNGGKSNLMLRAKGLPALPAGRSIQDEDPNKPVLAYNVYRMKAVDDTDESHWILVSETPVSDLTFSDEFANIPESGDYRYAVKTVYPSKELSLPEISNIINIVAAAGINNNDIDIKIYPNLVSDKLVIEFASVVHSYTIYNLTGVVIISKFINESDFIIPVSHLLSGTYILILNTDKGEVKTKFIKH